VHDPGFLVPLAAVAKQVLAYYCDPMLLKAVRLGLQQAVALYFGVINGKAAEAVYNARAQICTHNHW
jgi:hypothetical protein